MIIKTKKKISSRIVRLEASGELKEVVIKEDIFDPKNNLVELCFKGENSSGIIELSVGEIEKVNAELKRSGKQISKNVKVMKFGK